MDTPVTRSKQQIIDHYVYGLTDYLDVNHAHIPAIRVVLGLAYNEAEEQFRRDMDLQDSHIADLNRQIKALQAEVLSLQAKMGTMMVAAEIVDATVHTNGTAPSQEPEEPQAMPQHLQPATPAAAAQPRRGGRKPGAKNKPKETPRLALNEIASQIEGGAPGQMATIDRSLISDDFDLVALNGTLRREESHVTTHHGIPVRVTRKYIEIR